MSEINWFGVGIVLLNLGLMFFVANTRRIGLQRGAGISGWVSALIGMVILVFYKAPVFSGVSASIALLMGIVTVFAILAIVMPALSPHENLGLFRHFSKASMMFGWFIGYVMGMLVTILA